ncbi:MAG: hypothetical protein KAW12_10420 [Candidatus Aminicenantes bacterium]|nr:hypothetical protein [Candidatus Aminicenantes bacterium]
MVKNKITGYLQRRYSLMIPHFAREQTKLNKSFLGGPGGQFFKNAPLVAEGKKKLISWQLVWLLFVCLLLLCSAVRGEAGKDFYFRGALYQDWMGLKYEDSDLYHRLSSRLKLTLWNKPGAGWTAFVDLRSRFNLSYGGKSQLIVYDARLSYNRRSSKLFFSLGQMNLYDSAGIGQLTGGLVGYKFGRFLSAGGYAGLEPDIYRSRLDTAHNKFGVFVRYLGAGAKQFSLSLNRIGFDSQTERQFLYTGLLLPVKRLFVLFGNLEYEMDDKTKAEDRLSHLFLNGRVNVTKYVDITANYSSGRGLDYHRFLMEQSQDPTVQNSEIERFYYNETYGLRLSIKPVKGIRIYAARRESELKDRGIKNNTYRFGLSLINLLKTGVSVYGNYSVNEGDTSESNSYYISAARNFGKFSWSLSFANFFNGVYTGADGTPQVFHLPDRQTLSTNVFFILSRSLAFSVDYTYSYEKDNIEHQFFVRAILRK